MKIIFNNKINSMYIHIPFCKKICNYCNFNKVFIYKQNVYEYIKLLFKEIEIYKKQVNFKFLKTLYIGGGTPTSLNESQLFFFLNGLNRYIKLFYLKEFTIEINSDEITFKKIKIIKNFFVNRISIGVQSFDEKILKKIGRSHSNNDVFNLIKILKKEKFYNINIDLMYSIPGQNFKSFLKTLKIALNLKLSHYSFYPLIIEKHTLFMNLLKCNKLKLYNEIIELKIFKKILKFMKQKKFFHYEISSFAKNKSKMCLHNLNYWNNNKFIGIGAGASGYFKNYRYYNYKFITNYKNKILINKKPINKINRVNFFDSIEEEMFLGLRKRIGISKKNFFNKFGFSLKFIYKNIINKLKYKNLILENNKNISLTISGLFLANLVFEKFLL